MGFLKRAVTNLAVLGPAALAMSKIAEINVTSGVQSVTFSGLNGNADRLYWLVGWSPVPSSGGFTVDMQFNGDTTSSNYLTFRNQNQNGSLGGAAISNEPGIAAATNYGLGNWAVSIDYHIQVLPLSISALQYVVAFGWEAVHIPTGGPRRMSNNVGWWQPSGVTNVTSITLSVNGSTWAANGHFELWAQRTV